jgi:hypothetical protein
MTKDELMIFMQREKIRAEFGEEGVKRFDAELLKTAEDERGTAQR